MMKRIALGIWLTLLTTTAALAGNCSSFPYQLLNGQTADANQVMANFNLVRNCAINNLAALGANSDITALLGLTTPIAPSSGGTIVFAGGTSTGTANAQVIGPTVPSSFTLTSGYSVIFSAGLTNTAPATLNVNSTGVVNVLKGTPAGIIPLAANDIVSGNIYVATYDGTEFQLVGAASSVPSGSVFYTASGTVPSGYVAGDGSSQLRSAYPTLFAAIGTTYGSADSSHFNLPDCRARDIAGLDPGNATGRMTASTAQGVSAAALGNSGGEQAHTQTLAELVSHNHNLSFDVLSDPDTGAFTAMGPNTVGAGTTTTQNAGGGAAFNVLNPTIVLQCMIKT